MINRPYLSFRIRRGWFINWIGFRRTILSVAQCYAILNSSDISHFNLNRISDADNKIKLSCEPTWTSRKAELRIGCKILRFLSHRLTIILDYTQINVKLVDRIVELTCPESCISSDCVSLFPGGHAGL